MRKGMATGQGSGYKNVIGVDPKVHSESAQGIKQPQRITANTFQYISARSNPVDIQNSPEDLEFGNKGVYMSTTMSGKELDDFMQNNLDLKNHKDYEYVINQRLDGEFVGVLFLMSEQGAGRWQSSLGNKQFSKTDVNELKKRKYELFEERRQRDTELDNTISKRFKSYSDELLLERLNRRFKNNQNDDDEVYELFRRSQIKGFRVIPKFDTYEIEMR